MSCYEADKSELMHFVLSVRWHCTIWTKTTRLNEDIDRDVRRVCDIRPECTKMKFCNRIFIGKVIEHLTGKIDGFNELATLFG